MQNTHEQIKADQRLAGRLMGDSSPEVNDNDNRVLVRYPRPTLTVVAKTNKLVAAKAKASPKGHEAYLKALENSGTQVQFEKASTGVIVSGVIKTSDKYTVSIQTAEGTRVLFKHDISEFFVNAPVVH